MLNMEAEGAFVSVSGCCGEREKPPEFGAEVHARFLRER